MRRNVEQMWSNVEYEELRRGCGGLRRCHGVARELSQRLSLLKNAEVVGKRGAERVLEHQSMAECDGV
jgi:hypothetical protein